jgi:hypothetical protein
MNLFCVEVAMKTGTLHFARLSAFVLALSMGWGAAAQSADEYKKQVRVQLDLIELAAVRQLGRALEATHDIYYANLSYQTYTDVKYWLDEGTSYVFIGACDSDCGSLQLRLYDGYHHIVDADRQADFPIVSTTVGTSGWFYLRITMRNCAADSCWAGVGAYK